MQTSLCPVGCSQRSQIWNLSQSSFILRKNSTTDSTFVSVENFPSQRIKEFGSPLSVQFKYLCTDIKGNYYTRILSLQYRILVNTDWVWQLLNMKLKLRMCLSRASAKQKNQTTQESFNTSGWDGPHPVFQKAVKRGLKTSGLKAPAPHNRMCVIGF